MKKNKQQKEVGSCLELMNEKQIVKIEEGRGGASEKERERIHERVKLPSLLPSLSARSGWLRADLRGGMTDGVR